jgi:hypothetical protein
MRYILLFLAFTCCGYTPIEKMKHSYGYIYGYLKLVKKTNYIDCSSCSIVDDIVKQKIDNFNAKIEKIGAIKASSFVYERLEDKTNILTSEHVCKSINEFLSTDWDSKSIIKDNLLKIVASYYTFKPTVIVKTFSGSIKHIEHIIKTSKALDLCAMQIEDSWGIPVSFNTLCKYGEEIFNISASGGFYIPNAVPYRTGWFSGMYIVNDDSTNHQSINQNLYTLKINPGASGSAIFDKDGKVCGNINEMYTSLDLSSGAASNNIIKFLDLQ